MTVAHVYTVAFQGIDAREVDVQVHIGEGGNGLVTIVGLADKAVAESRERVRSALSAIGLAVPFKRITVNLAPADLPKEGSHYDLPIALGLLAAMGVLPASEMANYVALGELSLDAAVTPVAGVLNAALAASEQNRGLICPAGNGAEAAFAGGGDILATPSLIALVNHMKGASVLSPPVAKIAESRRTVPDLRDVKGQESAKRALEIAAAGGHNLLMLGPPGAGKSMLAQRLPGLLPPLDAREALEISMIQSLAGALEGGTISRHRPFRNPHHSASMPALVGGGVKVKPGEVSLAHLGVLFLDELPEFQRAVLDSLRQPIETGEAVVARANAHVRYPARFQLVAAMNPCPCGWLGVPAGGPHRCRCTPDQVSRYQSKISGPLLDRIDMQVEVQAAAPSSMLSDADGDTTSMVAQRVAAARTRQLKRQDGVNAALEPGLIDTHCALDAPAARFAENAARQLGWSGRSLHRVIKLARTIADLADTARIDVAHLAEAMQLRRGLPEQ